MLCEILVASLKLRLCSLALAVNAMPTLFPEVVTPFITALSPVTLIPLLALSRATTLNNRPPAAFTPFARLLRHVMLEPTDEMLYVTPVVWVE